MADNYSFDIVSDLDMNELDNAINMTLKEIANRFDFKGSKCSLTRSDKQLDLAADDDMKLRSLIEILETKMAKRLISIRFLDYQLAEAGLGGTMKQVILIKKGLSKEKAKEITTAVKNSKIKINAQIIDDKIRVISPKKDVLQEAIQFLKKEDFGIELQFSNYR